MRQAGGVVCRLSTPIACCTVPEEGSVEKSLSYQARRELLQQTVALFAANAALLGIALTVTKLT